MEILILFGRILLAIVFAVAGVAKLARLAQTRESLVEFGAPSRLAGFFAGLLILSEITVAFLLLPLATVWYGGIGALALLAVFCAAIAVNLLRHRQPHCNCFGQLHSTPIGWQTLARNAILGLVATVVILNGRDPHALSVIGWVHLLSPASAAILALALVNLTLLIGGVSFFAQVLKQQGRILLRLEALEQNSGGYARNEQPEAEQHIGLPLRTAAPDFALSDIDGKHISLGDLLKRQKPVLLLFSHPDCGPCQELLPDIGGWQNALDEDATIVLVAEGALAANRAKAEAHGIRNVLIQKDREVSEQYHAHGTPSAVLVAANGAIASYVAQGGEAIRNLIGALITQQQARLREEDALSVGDPAPDLAFEAVTGEKVALSNLGGKETVLLFWNPQCGFCERMLPDLKAWEANAPLDAPRLLVISAGDSGENRAMGLRSTVVSDTQSMAANAFLAHGTPMGILLDEQGRVASRVVAGAEAVFDLLNGRASSTDKLDLVLREV